MKQFLLIIFIVILATSIILMWPACKKKADSTDIDSITADINEIEITKTKVVAENKIAFVSDRDGNYEIYIMNIDGSEQRRLTDNPAYDSEPCFSLDGTKIVFGSNRDGDIYDYRVEEIYIMNADGSEQTRLTYSTEEDFRYINYLPSFSHNGSKIAFTSHRSGYAIYTMNIDGSDQKELIGIYSNDSSYCLSPDWSKIAITRSGELGEEDIGILVFTIDTYRDGSERASLTKKQAIGWSPCFSLDGTKIAFSSDRDGNWDIFIMNIDGTGQANLTNNPDTDDESPCFSP